MKKFLIFLPLVIAVLCIGCSSSHYEASTVPPPGPVYTAPAPPGVLPVGTDLVLRTERGINTDRAVPGQVFPAEVANEIVDAEGQVVVPRGSPAELVVVNARTGGAFGTPELQLAVRSLIVNGRRYDVVSGIESETARHGLGANGRTAKYVGGGALLGTLIGAFAGGGTGAAVGALSGAAGGAAVQVLTKGHRVRVPAETLLTFRLDEPIRLVGYRR